jgi:hypothetical protein
MAKQGNVTQCGSGVIFHQTSRGIGKIAPILYASRGEMSTCHLLCYFEPNDMRD